MSIFTEISLIISIATAIAMIMRLLKQPLIIGYIISGILTGPLFLDLIHSEETLMVFSKMGITILLFIIGLHLNPKIVREVGGVSLITGIGQILFTSLIGMGISFALGFDFIESLFIGLALTFSSTIIILKLLHDKGDLEKLYGKISVGFLLVQDIAASIILLSVSLFAQTDTDNTGLFFLVTFLEILALGLAFFAIAQYVLPFLVQLAAKSQETLFLFCIAWGMLVAAVFAAFGLSVEIGALLAGMTLSTTAFAQEISSRLRPLRDFFVVVFFILLGSEMVIDNIALLFFPSLLFSLFVLIGNPLIVFLLMNVMGYHKRTGFLAGLTVAQISEFSLILVTLGKESGLLGDYVVSLVTIVGLITIAISSYMIIYSNQLYTFVSPVLNFISIRKVTVPKPKTTSTKIDVILFGYGRAGVDYIKTFTKMGLNYLIIDFDPKVITKLQSEGYNALYGDAEDVEFMSELPLSSTKLVISAITDYETDLLIIRQTRLVNEKAVIITKTNNLQMAKDLYSVGANYVVMPHYIGARYAAKMIKRLGTSPSKYQKPREDHLRFLENRENIAIV